MSRTVIISALLVCVVLAGGVYLLTRQEEAAIQSNLTVAEALASDTVGYRRAMQPRPFSFPEDHGPHAGFRTEWWYYTGNLETKSGRHFGYQLTLFRNALTPPDTTARPRTSSWATRQLYMGHFALTDVEEEAFYDFERFSRGGAGLAGAQADSFRVWLEDWSVRSTSGTTFPMRLRARQDNVALDLTLRPSKPLVLQGERGLSKKGPGKGNASYYYSYTRLATRGTIRVDGEAYHVEGTSWMDREWSTSSLGEGQVGWDWFALQLSNGYDLMYYRLRNRNGSVSRYTEGLLVGPDGEAERLGAEDVQLEVLDRWTSPRGEAVYPVRWRLRVPDEEIRLELAPYVRNQELHGSVRYWEGAMRVEGEVGGAPVKGSGYLEMTGYGENSLPAS